MQETQETWVWSLGQEDPLEDPWNFPGNPHSILAWKIPRTEEPGGLQSMGLHSQTWLSMHAPVGVWKALRTSHCSGTAFSQADPEHGQHVSQLKCASRWACPLWISFLLSLLAVICHLHWPYTFKTWFKFGEKIYAWSTGFLKGCPVASGVAHLPEALSNCGSPLNCRQGTPAQDPAVPQGIPPPRGRHPSMAFLAERPDGQS